MPGEAAQLAGVLHVEVVGQVPQGFHALFVCHGSPHQRTLGPARQGRLDAVEAWQASRGRGSPDKSARDPCKLHRLARQRDMDGRCSR